MLRGEIARLKAQLAGAFGHPAEFAALGDALRVQTAALARLETELKTAKLEARDEVWWRGSARRGNGKRIALPKSVRANDRN